MANIHLIWALVQMAHYGAHAGYSASTRAGVFVTGHGEGTLATIQELASAMDMGVHVIRMGSLTDNGEDVRGVRAQVEETLAKGRPTIFVLADAEAADGDMLMRVTRVVNVSNTSTQAVIMAVGHGITADMLAMNVASGMEVSRDRIVGSSLFEEAMGKVFDRL